jgi:hypothetical protein
VAFRSRSASVPLRALKQRALRATVNRIQVRRCVLRRGDRILGMVSVRRRRRPQGQSGDRSDGGRHRARARVAGRPCARVRHQLRRRDSDGARALLPQGGHPPHPAHLGWPRPRRRTEEREAAACRQPRNPSRSSLPRDPARPPCPLCGERA